MACNTARGQEGKPDPRLAEIANKVVTVSAQVKPREVVVISGGVQKLPLMQAVAIEAEKAGGRRGASGSHHGSHRSAAF